VVGVEGVVDVVGVVFEGVVDAEATEEALGVGVGVRPDGAPGPKPREPARAITVMAAAPPTASTRSGEVPELGRGGSDGNTFVILGAADGPSGHLATVRTACRQLVIDSAADHSGGVPRCLVTGPTSGIGQAFAKALAAEGSDLLLVARDEARLRRVAEDLQRAHGVDCEVLAADLSDLEQTRSVESRLRAEPFAMLVNNAGFGMTQPFDASDVEAEEASLDVLVRAVMRLTHAALGPMLAAGSGDIVNVSSVA
jgi:hypothetical protein